MTETFTELDVEERRELLEKVESLPYGENVELTYFSSRRGSGPITRAGVTRAVEAVRDEESDIEVYVKTDELKGNIIVEVMEDHMENKHHAPIVARVTNYRGRRRTKRLGELLDVEVIDAP